MIFSKDLYKLFLLKENLRNVLPHDIRRINFVSLHKHAYENRK